MKFLIFIILIICISFGYTLKINDIKPDEISDNKILNPEQIQINNIPEEINDSTKYRKPDKANISGASVNAQGVTSLHYKNKRE